MSTATNAPFQTGGALLYLAATVTPFDETGCVATGKLRQHVRRMMASGVQGFMVGTRFGESPYLSQDEIISVHKTVLETAAALPVYLCVTGTTFEHLTQQLSSAESLGATGVAIPPPRGYKLNDDEVLDFYRRIANVSSVPVYAVHEPEGVTPITEPIYRTLRQEEVVWGLFDGAGDPFRLRRLGHSDPGTVYAYGDRLLLEAHYLKELAGVVSFTANIWPQMGIHLYTDGISELEPELHGRLNRLHEGGTIRLVKSKLNLGVRFPFSAPPPELVDALEAPTLEELEPFSTPDLGFD